MSRRVVVTGVGAVSPVGNDASSSWRALLEGRSGVQRVTRFDGAMFGPAALAGEVKDFQPETRISPKLLRHMDRNCQYGAYAALEAVEDAGLDVTKPLGEAAGVVFGSG